MFESLQDVAYVLELACWNSSLSQHCKMNSIDNLNGEKKLQRSLICGANSVIPHVLSFLLHFPIYIPYPRMR